MINKYFSIFLLLCASQLSQAQNNLDANAIKANDVRISAWATACTVERGWLDIADKSLGFTSIGSTQNAIGPIAGSSMVLSLGDSGVAVLTFAEPIKNVEGPDFAVFENGFLDPLDSTRAFLELAFVEVSSDGVNYFRFPAQYTGQDTAQNDNFTYSRGQDYINLAGSYIYGYGTPFDLELLKDSVGLDVNNVTHVRIVDVIGSLDSSIGSRDFYGNMINDPYPTAFASGGFDLTGVAVLNATSTSVKHHNLYAEITIAPNPVKDLLNISLENQQKFYYQLVNSSGRLIKQGMAESGYGIDVSELSAGIYYGNIECGDKKSSIKFVKE